MSQHYIYLFDPLCGWCYGASKGLAELSYRREVEILPAGLFAGENGRSLDRAFAAHAWQTDRRIEKLTGMPFSQTYKERVLDAQGQRLDSTQATLAHTAVMITAPEKGISALHKIQRARYVAGKDITDPVILSTILKDAGFGAAADLFSAGAEELSGENRRRLSYGQAYLGCMASQAVPALFREEGEGVRLVPASCLYEPGKRMEELCN